jgi:calcium-dependent protein kinase
LDFAPRKEIRHLDAGEKIFDLYHWSQEDVLQEEGAGGKVVVCWPKMPAGPEGAAAAPEARVMKMIAKASHAKDGEEEQFRVAHLALLNMPLHPGILAPREVLEDQKIYYIVMDRASGGTFFEGLIQDHADGTMPPHAVKRLLIELLQAVGHIHKYGVIHRDIKPDNLLMHFVDDPQAPDGRARRVALIDFDYADLALARGGDPDSTDHYCGTYRFSAPETFQGHFSRASDLYSVGVILYLLMTGKMPYRDDLFQALHSCRAEGERIMADVASSMRREQIDWSCAPWPAEPLCRGFCERMLQCDSGRRFQTVEEALAHEWLR